MREIRARGHGTLHARLAHGWRAKRELGARHGPFFESGFHDNALPASLGIKKARNAQREKACRDTALGEQSVAHAR
jgi:hypothetical protein